MADDQESTGGALRPRVRNLLGVAALLAAMAAAGCASEPKPIVTGEANIPPSNYKPELLAYLRTYLNDPTGVRDAFITEPALRPVAGAERYASCLRFNAKNSVGKYEGSRDRLVVFYSGRVDAMVPARPEQCKDANWQPFPELQKLTR